MLTQDDVIGYVYVDVRKLEYNVPLDQWFPMKTSLKKALRKKSEMHLIVTKMPSPNSLDSMKSMATYAAKNAGVTAWPKDSLAEPRGTYHYPNGGGDHEPDDIEDLDILHEAYVDHNGSSPRMKSLQATTSGAKSHPLAPECLENGGHVNNGYGKEHNGKLRHLTGF